MNENKVIDLSKLPPPTCDLCGKAFMRYDPRLLKTCVIRGDVEIGVIALCNKCVDEYKKNPKKSYETIYNKLNGGHDKFCHNTTADLTP
jgi:hypothetical protein